MSEEKIEYKVSVPLFEKGELETFDNHIHEIVEEYSKLVLKEKEQILTQRIIIKQEEDLEETKKCLKEANKEIERLNNIINKAIEYVEESYNETVEGIEGIAKFFSKRNETLLKILKGSDKK